MATAQKVWVASNDSAIIEIDRAVAERSILIKNMLEDIGDDTISANNPIPIQNVRFTLLFDTFASIANQYIGQRGRPQKGHRVVRTSSQ